jgi:hypothetical protein
MGGLDKKSEEIGSIFAKEMALSGSFSATLEKNFLQIQPKNRMSSPKMA